MEWGRPCVNQAAAGDAELRSGSVGLWRGVLVIQVEKLNRHLLYQVRIQEEHRG